MEQGKGWAAQIGPPMQEETWKPAERVYRQTTAKACEKGWPPSLQCMRLAGGDITSKMNFLCGKQA